MYGHISTEVERLRVKIKQECHCSEKQCVIFVTCYAWCFCSIFKTHFLHKVYTRELTSEINQSNSDSDIK